MTLEEMLLEIKNIPGEDGWWKHRAEDTFQGVAIELLNVYHIPADDIVDMLTKLYYVTAECYGG